MHMRLFKQNGTGPFLAEISNGTKSKTNDRTLFSLTDESITVEMIYRVNEVEKLELLKLLPGLNEKEVFRLDDKDKSRPYKVVISDKGTFNQVRLGKVTTLNGANHSNRYIAVRKIKSQEKISAKQRNLSRDEVVKSTEHELNLQANLMAFNAANDIALTFLVVDGLNKHQEQQLYQCMPLADIGNGTSFIKLMENATLTETERDILTTHIIKTLLNCAAKINDKNFFLRDIKPDNILFSSEGDIWMADFGSAAFYLINGSRIIASRLSDSKYKPPYLLFQASTDQEKDRILDSWALALTLLQFADTRLNTYVQQNFHSAAAFRYTAGNGNSPKEIKENCHDIISTLKLHPSFKKLSESLQTVILGLLEIDSSKRKPIRQLVDQYNKENSFYQSPPSNEKETIKKLIKKTIDTAKTNEATTKTDSPISKREPYIDDAYYNELEPTTTITQSMPSPSK